MAGETTDDRRSAKTGTRATPFALHELEGDFESVEESTAGLLDLIKRQWRHRQWLAIGIALSCVVGGGFLLFNGSYLLGLGLVLAGLFAATFAMASGRHLEVEVETVELCLALLEELRDAVDATGQCAVTVDMRSSGHVAKLQRGDEASEILDHWFTIDLTLRKHSGLRLELVEHVRNNASDNKLGKRLGRDYHVALYNDPSCDEQMLREMVVSHVSAPTGTSVKSRVREGLDVFNAAIDQLRVSYRQRRSKLVEALDELSVAQET